MRTVFPAAAVAAVLALTACGSSSAVAHDASPGAAPESVAASGVSPVLTNSNGTACRAFHRAITKGVPASAARENTRSWLQGQTASASPELQAAIRRFISVWNNPGDLAKISMAQQEVGHLCRHA